MGRLVSKSVRVNGTGETLVSFASNRPGGAQIGHFSGGTETRCVPLALSGGSPLEDRKHLVITVPIERVWLGRSGVTTSTGYRIRGASRGGNLDLPPKVDDYSNRMQFLRGQYVALPLLSGVTFCVRIGASVEDVNSLETS